MVFSKCYFSPRKCEAYLQCYIHKKDARKGETTHGKYKDSGHNRNSNRVQRITQIFAQAAHKDCSTIFPLALGRR